MKSSTAVSTRNEGMEIAKSVGILVAIFGIAVGVVALKVSQKTPAPVMSISWFMVTLSRLLAIFGLKFFALPG